MPEGIQVGDQGARLRNVILVVLILMVVGNTKYNSLVYFHVILQKRFLFTLFQVYKR